MLILARTRAFLSLSFYVKSQPNLCEITPVCLSAGVRAALPPNAYNKTRHSKHCTMWSAPNYVRAFACPFCAPSPFKKHLRIILNWTRAHASEYRFLFTTPPSLPSNHVFSSAQSGYIVYDSMNVHSCNMVTPRHMFSLWNRSVDSVVKDLILDGANDCWCWTLIF